jgi:hypothetical protein
MATRINLPISPAGAVDNVEAFDKMSDWIRSPEDFGPAAAAIGRAGQKYCDILGAIPGAQSGIFGPTFAAGNVMCKPYWDGAGYDGPSEQPPFSGGQCTFQYSVDAFEINPNGSESFEGQSYVLGPVTEYSVTKTGPFQKTLRLRGRNNSGDTEVVNYLSGGNARFGPLTPTGGQQDNCGDPPGVLAPGDNPPPTPTFPPGEEPGVDPTGQPFFYVPPIDDPTGTGDPVPVPDPNPTGGGGGEGGPTEPPVAGDEESGTPGDEEFPPPEDGRRWVGCCIRLTSIPVGTGTVPGTSPETILTEVVGNARLLFDSVNGDGYDTPVQIRSAGVCLWEPVKGLSPKGVRVNLKPGFSYSYTPYSVSEED